MMAIQPEVLFVGLHDFIISSVDQILNWFKIV